MNPPQDEEKLRTLGNRLRSGWAEQHPVSQKSLDTVRNAVRDQYARDQKAKQSQPPPPKPPKSRGMER